MSHFTSIKTQIKDLDALRAALRELGLSLEANAEARGWPDQPTKHGEYVIRLKGPYDVALNRNPKTGCYDLDADLWTDAEGYAAKFNLGWKSSTVETELGKHYGKLVQLYGVHKATIEARKHGHQVTRSTGQNGQIRLVLTGTNL